MCIKTPLLCPTNSNISYTFNCYTICCFNSECSCGQCRNCSNTSAIANISNWYCYNRISNRSRTAATIAGQNIRGWFSLYDFRRARRRKSLCFMFMFIFSSIFLENDSGQQSLQCCYCNAVICNGHSLCLCLTDAREYMPACKHAGATVYHQAVGRECGGKVVTRDNVYLQRIAEMLAQEAREFYTPYILVLRHMAACLGYEYASIAGERKKRFGS